MTSLELAACAARAAADKKARDVVVLDISELLGITDYFVICSGSSDRLVRTIAEEVERRCRESGMRPRRREGEREASWLLLDYGDVVVHIFREEARQYYELERLWRDAPRVVVSGIEQAAV